MKKTWDVNISAKVSYHVEVEAETKEEAIKYGREAWEVCDIDEICFYDEEYEAEEE